MGSGETTTARDREAQQGALAPLPLSTGSDRVDVSPATARVSRLSGRRLAAHCLPLVRGLFRGGAEDYWLQGLEELVLASCRRGRASCSARRAGLSGSVGRPVPSVVLVAAAVALRLCRREPKVGAHCRRRLLRLGQVACQPLQPRRCVDRALRSGAPKVANNRGIGGDKCF